MPIKLKLLGCNFGCWCLFVSESNDESAIWAASMHEICLVSELYH